MLSEPLLRSRLTSARAKRTRFASSKALRRSSEVLSGARLSIEFIVYQRNPSIFSQSALELPRPQPVLPQVSCELFEYLLRLSDEATRPHLHRRSPREHKLHGIYPARHPADPDHGHTCYPRNLVYGSQSHRLYRRPREPAAQEDTPFVRIHDERRNGIDERYRVGLGLFGGCSVGDDALVRQLR